MFEDYSRQSLPSKHYRELLGSAICVFNSNNQFIIENILRIDNLNYSWHELIDKASGELLISIKETITKNSNKKIASLFSDLISRRNRIIHSFQITKDGEQILSTKTRKNEQFVISEEYLSEFIRDNEALSSSLHKFRDF